MVALNTCCLPTKYESGNIIWTRYNRVFNSQTQPKTKQSLCIESLRPRGDRQLTNKASHLSGRTDGEITGHDLQCLKQSVYKTPVQHDTEGESGELMGRRPHDNTPPRRTKNFRPHTLTSKRGFRKHFRLEIMTRRIVWLGGRHSRFQRGAVFVTALLSVRSWQKIHYRLQCVLISAIGESVRPSVRERSQSSDIIWYLNHRSREFHKEAKKEYRN